MRTALAVVIISLLIAYIGGCGDSLPEGATVIVTLTDGQVLTIDDATGWDHESGKILIWRGAATNLPDDVDYSLPCHQIAEYRVILRKLNTELE